MGMETSFPIPLNKTSFNTSELTSVEWEEIRKLASGLNKDISALKGEGWGDFRRLFLRLAEDARVYRQYGPYCSGPIEQLLRLDSSVERREEEELIQANAA